MHTPEYDELMALEQDRFNIWQRAKAQANGWIIVESTTKDATS